LQLASETSLEALQGTCELTLESGVISASIIANELRRLTTSERLKTLAKEIVPTLTVEPMADCHRYDRLRERSHVH
jgi:hypothetical protein